MSLKRTTRRWTWFLLLLPVFSLLIWLFVRPSGLRMVGTYPFTVPIGESVTTLPSGFLLWEKGAAGGGITAIFRDWSGYERWRIHHTDDKSLFWTDLAPGGHDFAWVESKPGEQPIITIWHDGREMQRRRVGMPGEQCTWVDIRDDGTTWFATCTMTTLHLYAMRAGNILQGEAPLPRTLPGSTMPLDYNGIQEGNVKIPACVLAPNAVTLRVAACTETMSTTTYYPAFLTFRLRTIGNRLDLQLAARNTTTVKYLEEKWFDVVPTIHSNYRIAVPSGAGWIIPDERAGGYSSDCDQTLDGRYALVARIKTGFLGAGAVRKPWRFLSRWLPEKTYLTLDLYERPGVIRAHTAIALPKMGKPRLDFHAVHLAPDGRAALVTVGEAVYLFTR